jgi:cyclopropane fatty-acyl-phospholipid synthase-like methyltransferase
MDISSLKSGDHHYMAYVGPPTQYDLMGATQFRLLCSLGLRSDHQVLDVGCGSLRAGRLLISYLDEDRYCGIEPNKWLIEEAIEYQVGKDMIRMKKPHFDHNHEFATKVFFRKFDFIIAQSIFSHAGTDYIRTALGNFKKSLKPDGLIAATFVEGATNFEGNGWIYPECVHYRPSAIRRLAEEAELFIKKIPWYHPRQTWYLLVNSKRRLPSKAMTHFLSGAVLYDAETAESWKRSLRYIHLMKKYVRYVENYLEHILPSPITRRLKEIKKMLTTGEGKKDL